MKKYILSSLILIASFYSYSQDSYLDYYVAPSRSYLDWSTPKSIIKTFLKSRVTSNELNVQSRRRKTPMGHGMINFNCKLTNGQRVNFWSGITGQHDPKQSKQQVFKDGLGVSVLFFPYADGYIQSNEEVKGILSAFRGRTEKNIAGKTSQLKPRFIRFKIDEKQCDDVFDYFNAFRGKSYIKAQSKETLNELPDEKKLFFGLHLDPFKLYSENGPDGVLGGGCTSYATGYLKVIGKYNDFFDKNMKLELDVSSKVLGKKNENFVSFKSLVFGKNGKSWSHNDPNSTRLSFYDPEKTWDLFDSLLNCNGSTTNFNKCSQETRSWLYSNDIKLKRVENKVNGHYKERPFTNTLEGIEIIN